MAYYDDRQYYPPPPRDRASRPSNHDYYYPSSASPANPYPTDVVHRYDGSNDSVEEIPRDYPPGEYAYDYGYPPHPRRSRVSTVPESARRSHSMGGGGTARQYYDDSDQYYRPSRGRKSRHPDDRHGGGRHRSKYSRSPSSDSRSPPPRHSRRRKSISEQALGALGLAGAAARSRSRGRHHRSYSPSPTRGGRGNHRREKSEQRIAHAVKAAVTAGAVEAFRLRKDPGDWQGEKGKRILTAALTAGGTEGLVDRDPSKHSKRHLVESTLAGLAANHFVNGPRSRSRSRHGRGRSRSKHRSSVGNLAAKGALAAAGKEAWDRYRSRSRSRARGRGSDRDDADSLAYGEGSPRRSKRRSRSVSDYISRGLEALGLENSSTPRDRDDRDRHHDRDYHRPRKSRHGGTRSSRYDSPTTDYDRYSYYSDDDYDHSPRRSNGGSSARRSRYSRDVGRPTTNSTNYYYPNYTTTTTIPPSSNEIIKRHNQAKHAEEDTGSDLGNSTDEEHQHKKLTRQTLVAAGLATVATIHAAHGLHESMEKHAEHVQMVKDGEMSPEEARRLRLKTNLTDAASVGMAALGVKGVIGQWKSADAKRRERASFAKERSARRGKRERDQALKQRRRARSHSYGNRVRTMYPDEIEENYEDRSRNRRESLF